jgi:hypothetical protein
MKFTHIELGILQAALLNQYTMLRDKGFDTTDTYTLLIRVELQLNGT